MSKKSPLRDDGAMLKDFLAFSRILTGVENLDEDLGRQYLDRLKSTPFDPLLRQILDRFHGLKGGATLINQVKILLLGDDTLRPTICQIIPLWYRSAMQGENPLSPSAVPYGAEEEYFIGLAWSVIGAHVPGLSGSDFGLRTDIPERRFASIKRGRS